MEPSSASEATVALFDDILQNPSTFIAGARGLVEVLSEDPDNSLPAALFGVHLSGLLAVVLTRDLSSEESERLLSLLSSRNLEMGLLVRSLRTQAPS